MKHTIRVASCQIAILAMVGFSGCANQQYATPEEAVRNACSSLGPKATSGALIGAAAGAAGGTLIGAAAGNTKGALIGLGVGALVGAIAGVAAGHHLDQQDCAQAQVALQQMQNLPTGESVAWSSPTGSHGSITAFSDDYQVGDRVCRRIRSDIYLQGHAPVYGDEGVTCRDANGDWARVSQ